MANTKQKKQTEKTDRSGFFTSRASTPKAAGLTDRDQDGDGGNDTIPLQSSPGPQNLPVTQDFLQNCLEDMSSSGIHTEHSEGAPQRRAGAGRQDSTCGTKAGRSSRCT
ncbi:Hypothetical predicted protein [Pelobates cultripes]|uniref:Uncharacterized protein n=1 Tax=Pelobates cultripes TaxID=61616 RepID=A0AAD1SZX4_PELCU|nr:Hypothetical predicted protein [Pelobates cultripes]